MPILSGDQLIGRIDPTFDRGHKHLMINAVHAEPATSIAGETGQAIAVAIQNWQRFSAQQRSAIATRYLRAGNGYSPKDQAMIAALDALFADHRLPTT